MKRLRQRFRRNRAELDLRVDSRKNLACLSAKRFAECLEPSEDALPVLPRVVGLYLDEAKSVFLDSGCVMFP